ncbi:hypothetical protein DYB38_010076 [Aphanomyces astaci]|uniref:DDE-1 domain-containing protein n=1 Tax=Aphanomyces astaci TaxID=112090 RepID=A0A397E514_APHAT|nr:hypothetical protein DYB38_010076 [Aphanomyces astaci]
MRLRPTQYPISTKLEAIGLLESMSCREVARVLKVPRRTVRSWLAERLELLAYDGNKKNNKLEPGGRYKEFPDPPGLQTVLAEVAAEFARDFHHEYACYCKDCVFNVDETGMYYDLPPSYIWEVRGGSSKLSAREKHSMRMTAVLTVRADGTKLPLMFIMRGTPGGRIESSEFPTFPCEHYYAVQTKAWMYGRVWAQYLQEVLGESIEEPSVVLMDNFEGHVSAPSYKIMYEEVVMAPFKRNLSNLWLLEEQIIGDDPYSLTAQQKRMAMVQRPISAWDLVSEDVVRRSFEKAIPAPEHNANQ